MENNTHFLYILECKDGSYYTGYTNDLEKRFKKHEEGKGAKYTRGRGPLKLVFQQAFPTKQEAMRMEFAVKKLNRAQKERMIKEGSVSYVAAKELQQ
ncbi:MAG: GIY-YIG nuclease family protein [Bacillota bacterium]|jgi:putative endonuclease|uniref:GIY-YIG nuclease family protein n=1 Tax=Fictibacillus norfolkensis TaxID=2762233 RepID=A0ABR8SRR2_9BACL|nr:MULTISPECIES: GIY-YIG nuclease family protein [Fictibacillus]MBD7966183.1 GIY-YIG nuclease family protein [Fictibacillus norfolkensis]MBH0171879.1 GIY-YIG nuclease family protein [Fictibacillus sp. 18YEL24]